jgi:hypothetical protein
MLNLKAMKRILCALMLSPLVVFAQVDVSMKFTYNGQGVCRYEITLKNGDVALAKGTTNDAGEVSFSGVSLLSKEVNVYGYRKSDKGEFKFDINGYITLNDSHYAEVKMDELLKEMSSGSGLPASMLAGGWGLTNLDCAAASSSSKENPTPPDSEADEADNGNIPTAGESLAIQEQGLRNEISGLDRKISKSEGELNQLKAAGADVRDIEIMQLDIEEMKLKRERKKVMLERNLAMQQGALSEPERKAFSDREDSYSAREKDFRESRKELEKEKKEEKKASKDDGEKSGGRMDGAKLKMEISSVKTQIKLKESSLNKSREKGDPAEEIAEKERELRALHERLDALEAQQAESE